MMLPCSSRLSNVVVFSGSFLLSSFRALSGGGRGYSTLSGARKVSAYVEISKLGAG